MFHVEFIFAGRCVRNPHPTLSGAIENARHILANWTTIKSVVVLGDRCGDYNVTTVLTKE
jgi:hypothetical protein